MSISNPAEPRHLVAVFGGAVAGSEATRVLAEAGIDVVVFEQNPRPYGKIEDGLPRWHDKQRLKEYGKIDGRLDRDGVEYVPSTTLGRDIGFDDVLSWGFSAVLLATGAWDDRGLQVEGADDYIDKGLVYQNPLVYWFNHNHQKDFEGQTYEIPNDTVVIGGGLASIDVVKIVMLELVGKALREKHGIDVPMVHMEHKGIAKTLETHGIAFDDLGVKKVFLIYRRRNEDMPLASAPDGADEARLKKVEQTRLKLLKNVMDKFFVDFQERTLPQELIVEDGRLVGLKCCRTEVDGRRAIPLEGTDHEIRAEMFISSIGSIPQPIAGIAQKGAYYKYKDWDTGELEDHDGVFGVGNTVTGQGNIRVSLKHGQFVGNHVIANYLGVGEGDRAADNIMAAGEAKGEAGAAAVQEHIESKAPPSIEAHGAIMARVRARQAEVGYEGDYAAWIQKVSPPELFELG